MATKPAKKKPAPTSPAATVLRVADKLEHAAALARISVEAGRPLRAAYHIDSIVSFLEVDLAALHMAAGIHRRSEG